MTHHDVTLVERLAGIVPGSPIDRAFRARGEARRLAEDSYRRLLLPQEAGPASLTERRAVAAFTGVLHGEEQTRDHLLALLRETGPAAWPLARLIEREAGNSARPGPYGRFPEGPLTAEDLDGPPYAVAAPQRQELGPRLAAALEYAHLLAFRPQGTAPETLAALAHAGWSRGGIALLAEIVGLVGFQSRVIAGLRSCISADLPAAG